MTPFLLQSIRYVFITYLKKLAKLLKNPKPGQFVVYWWRRGGLAWLESKWIALRTSLPGGTGGKRKLCLMPYYSCYIYLTWRSKEVRKKEGSKVMIRGWKTTKMDRTKGNGRIDPFKYYVLYLSCIVSIAVENLK